MIVKLRVMHGKLQNRKGESAGLELKIRGSQFVIGSDSDCSMCCRSRSVSAHHCEIRRQGEEAIVKDLQSETGTYVNDLLVEQEQVLQNGDRLRIGRLEFEVLIDASSPKRPARRPSGSEPKVDPVAEYISDLLVEADEEDRARRLEDPEARQFRLEPAEKEPEGTPADAADKAEAGAKRRQRPPKKPPGKLPPPPPLITDNTVQAAEEVIKKLFTQDKRSKPLSP